MSDNQRAVSYSTVRAADMLAVAVNTLIKTGALSARSPAADALLDYAGSRFRGFDSIAALEAHVAQNGRPRL